MAETVARSCDRELMDDGSGYVKCSSDHRFAITKDGLVEVTVSSSGEEVRGKSYPTTQRCPHQYGGMMFNISFG
jgi:hypothetical protein